MGYLVLARKYRPQTFDEVYGQDHITRTLKNAIKMDRIAHAYLFTGSRGVGKTSMARIFAKSLNCENGPTENPCGVCGNCREITAGVSQDVIEIDGASNTGVEDIRDLQKELMYSTSNSKYKIYIIDEVHMLSKSAFNALLKTLEEPPANVIFIFATTEPHKILPTIISRCQRYDCKRIHPDLIVARLKEIAESERIHIEEEALFVIAKKAEGGMRDALSLTDQVISYGTDNITHENVLGIFGIVHTEVYQKIVQGIIEKNPSELIRILHDILDRGNDLQEFLNGFLEYLRSLLFLKIGVKLKDVPAVLISEMEKIVENFTENDLLYMMTFCVQIKTDAKMSNNPVLIAEMSFIKLTQIASMIPVKEIIGKLEKVQASVAAVQTRASGIASPGMPYGGSPKIKTQTQTGQSPSLTQNFKQMISQKKSSFVQPSSGESPAKIEFTPDSFRENWDLIISKINKYYPLAVNFLKRCQIDEISEKRIKLITNEKLGFDQINKIRDFIGDVISKHFQTKIGIFVNFVKVEKKTPVKDVITVEDIRKENPGLADFIEASNSRISRVK
ncbi:MAG: DNA polymerase III subunit gamma/tau [Candidatus Cloacimonadota bacterium]|nr:MAG: DNA polymerase III subunit gamma/tau [Candidatus Cloacimonadota bacterium]